MTTEITTQAIDPLSVAGSTDLDAEEVQAVENAVAALNPSANKILAGIGSGNHHLRLILLQTMPSGTALLLRTFNALSDEGNLTDFGEKLAEYVAYLAGTAPAPATRAAVAQQLTQRVEASTSVGSR